MLLGTLLNIENFAYRVADRLKPELFNNYDNQQVCQAILKVVERNQPVHLLTVMPAYVAISGATQESARTVLLRLAEQESIVTARTREISQEGLSAEVLDVLVERWQRRELLRLSLNLRESSIREDCEVQDTIGRLAEDTDRIAAATSQAQTTKDHLNKLVEEGKARYESGAKLLGPAVFGMKKLDLMLDGAHPGGLITTAGWTGSGKSSEFNTIVNNCTELGIPTYNWSGELSPDRQLHRLLAAETGINSRVIAKGGYYNEQEYPGGLAKIDAAAERIQKAGHIFESGSMTLTRLLTTVSYHYRVNGVRVFLFDRKELFTLTGKSGNSDAEIGMILARLRALMTELKDACSFVASQVRKEHMKNPGSRPTLADVIGAGEVTASSTAVMMVYRPEYYGILQDEHGNSLKGVAYLDVVKNSFGETGEVRCLFRPATSQFIDEDDGVDEDFLPKVPAFGQMVKPDLTQDTPF